VANRAAVEVDTSAAKSVLCYAELAIDPRGVMITRCLATFR